jgi:lipoate---protein ligase
MGAVRGAGARTRRRSLSPQAGSARAGAWRVLVRHAAPADLHRELPDPGCERVARVCVPSAPAVVIGSAQPAAEFDRRRLDSAGVDLVRRRSGGGAVLVAPQRQVWVDLFVPAGDVLADLDVGRSFYWLGDAFAQAIATVLDTAGEEAGIAVHRGRTQSTPWSKTLCYAGLGAGEVTVAGRKVVGLSQRRDRSGAWIHSMALLGPMQGELADFLSGSSLHRAAARAELEATGLRDAEHLGDALTEALIDRLP